MNARALFACLLTAVAAAADPALPGAAAHATPPPRVFAESELRELLRGALVAVLPPEAEVGAIHHRGDLALRGVGVTVTVDPPAAAAGGRVALRARVSTSLEARWLSFSADVAAPGRGVVFRRGAAVRIVARSGAVTVTAEGEAQQDGVVGDRIHVLCPALRRVLVGRVVDASTVRIDLGGPR